METKTSDEDAILIRNCTKFSVSVFTDTLKLSKYVLFYENLLWVVFNDNLYRVMNTYALTSIFHSTYILNINVQNQKKNDNLATAYFIPREIREKMPINKNKKETSLIVIHINTCVYHWQLIFSRSFSNSCVWSHKTRHTIILISHTNCNHAEVGTKLGL